MKFLIYSDVHWSESTSVLHTRGEKYSKRLELLLKSVNWAESLATLNNCDEVLCLGDFFDKHYLNDEELTSLNDIRWCNLPHTFIVGNHESKEGTLKFNTTNSLSKLGFKIISEPTYFHYVNDCDILMLPYIKEDDIKSLSEYWNNNDNEQFKLVLNHNELKGVNYGRYVSKNGFDMKDIQDNCDLYLNGHLHNGGEVANKIINVGSLSAHNYTNDSFNYSYGCWILDTLNDTLDFFENPYSLNIYKLDINSSKDLSKLDNLKPNAIVTVKCAEEYTKNVTSALTNCIDSKIITTYHETAQIEENDASTLNVNHLSKFKECCIDIIGSDDIIISEIQEICK